MRTPAEAWHWGARAGEVGHRPLGLRDLGVHGPVGLSLASRSGGCQQVQVTSVPCPVLRTCAWYLVPSAQYLVLGVCCFLQVHGVQCPHPTAPAAAQDQRGASAGASAR